MDVKLKTTSLPCFEGKLQVDGTSQESQPRFVGGRRRVRMRIQRSEGDNEGNIGYLAFIILPLI